jgi:hypothetical protein
MTRRNMHRANGARSKEVQMLKRTPAVVPPKQHKIAGLALDCSSESRH